MRDWPEAAEHLGRAYLRYSFTKGTEQEVDFLVAVLGLGPETRVLDVGCGPGRHAHALAARGIPIHGIDVAPRFIDLAREGAPPLATFEVADARDLAYRDEFAVAISLCQGGMVLPLDRMAAAAPTIAFTAMSAYFGVRHLEGTDDFDAATGTNREQTSVKDEAGRDRDFVLETSLFTPRELRLMCEAAGLTVEHLWSVGPGEYAERPPDIHHPEWFVVARRHGAETAHRHGPGPVVT